MNDSVECNGQRLGDIELSVIESKMADRGFASAPGVRRSLMRLASENAYHPIKEWLDGLVWGGEDVFGNLMSHFRFEHQGISERFFWRFLVGCVGKVWSDGWEQNVMLTMDGIQGLGKSHLSGWLLPDSMKPYFVEGGLDPDHKDTKIRIVSNFLWEVGELQGTTKKSDIESLKNIITQRRVTVRLPYGRFDIDKPITCSFIGTVNENGAGFLNDVTGNRRFAIVKILDLDWNYIQLDRSQLWAQVNQAYQNGEKGTFTPAEQAEQHTINSEYDTLSHVEQILLKRYVIDPSRYAGDWIPAAEIIGNLEFDGLVKSNQRLHFMELAGILTKAGCGRSRSNSITGYGRSVCYSGLREKTKVKSSNPWNP